MVTVKLGNWSLGFGADMNNGHKKPLALIIIDGWGFSDEQKGNAIALARTPNYDEICEKYPRTNLAASGVRVGLTPESPGNSEVGHLNLGTGRVVKTKRATVAEAVNTGEFFDNEVLKKAFATAKRNDSAVHFIGLLSDGEIHSSLGNLFALLRMAKNEGITEKAYIHAVLDGRDVPQRTADIYVEATEIKLADIGLGKIATLCGRSYAMDKSQNWDKTARTFTMLVHGEGERAFDAITAIRGSYLRGINDEFVQPIVLEEIRGIPVAKIQTGDVVIYFNHRSDGMRQIVKALSLTDTAEITTFGKPQIETVCLTEYDRKYNLPVAFHIKEEANALAQVFADNGILNCRLTETEKYAHVTYFFNGGVETEHPCEQRVLVPSPKVLTNEIQPEMGCFKVTDKLLRGLEAGENDVFIVNLAAADLIAHTGNLEKTIQAVQFVDTCLGSIVSKIHEVGGIAMITSDHGNCEQMSDLTNGKPHKSHTTNPVPFHLVANHTNGLKLRENGALEDVAPTILGILGIEKPIEMTGNDLRTE